MRAHTFAIFLAAAAASLVDVAKRAVSTTNSFCSTLQSIVTKSSIQKQATSYCSSFLSITPATVTITSTSTTVVPSSGVSITGTTTITVSGVTTSTSTVVIASSFIVPSQCSAGGSVNRRAASSVSKPAPWATYASSVLSSACKCLSLPTPTSTVTATVKATSTTRVVSNVQAASTVTAYSTVVPTTSVTQTFSTFRIMATGSATDADGLFGRFIGYNRRADPDISTYELVFGYGGSGFILTDSCLLQQVTQVGLFYTARAYGKQGGGSAVEFLNRDDQDAGRSPAGYNLLSCQLGVDGTLACGISGATATQVCDGGSGYADNTWALTPGVSGLACVGMKAVVAGYYDT